MAVPHRQVRAAYTADAVTVYQAYPAEIAEPAVAAGRFVPPFKRDRMTWIKPSFRWMMYRCGLQAGPHRVRDLVRSGDLAAAAAALPPERPYPLPAAVAA